MKDEVNCPHCGHEWESHWLDRLSGRCGCMWNKPKPPEPPTPTPDPRVEAVKAAIFDELDRQHEESEIDGAGYWDREWGRCDGEPDWGMVAAAAVDAVLEAMSDEKIREIRDLCETVLDGEPMTFTGEDGMAAAVLRIITKPTPEEL